MHVKAVFAAILLALAVSGCTTPETLRLDVPQLHERVTATYSDDDATAELSLRIVPVQTWLRDGSRGEAYALFLDPGSDEATVPAAAFTYDTCLRPIARHQETEAGDELDYRMLLDPPPPILPVAGQRLEGDHEAADQVRHGATAGGEDDFVYAWAEEDVQVVVALAGGRDVSARLQRADPSSSELLRSWRWLGSYDETRELPVRIQTNSWRGNGDWRLVDHESSGPLIEPKCFPLTDPAGPKTQLSSRATITDPPFVYLLSEAIEAAEATPVALELQEYLTRHADAYIERWAFGDDEGLPAWTLTYAAPDETARIVVTCRLLATEGPANEQNTVSACTDATDEGTTTTPGPAPQATEISDYPHWFDVFDDVFGSEPAAGAFGLDDQGRLRGELYVPGVGTWDRLEYDATGHTMSGLEGTFAALEEKAAPRVDR